MSFTQKIIAPTDFSPASALALDAAAILARQFDAEIHLLYVFDPTLLSPLYVVPGAAALPIPMKEPEEVERGLRHELARVRDERLTGVRHVELVIKQHASASQGICEYATSSGADLVVLGTHGRTGIAHLLIGSVAERVVRHCTCPVLTMRSHAK